jgi:hypothetical protein
MDRRAFLKGLVATAAGVLVPGQVLAEPERRVWALDRTMVQPKGGYLLDTGWFDATLPDGMIWLPISREEIVVSDARYYQHMPTAWINVGGEHMRVVGIHPWPVSAHSVLEVERGITLTA